MFEITSGKIEKAQKVVLYGPEGVGKSTFASFFPEPVFSDIEGGTSNLNLSRLPTPSSWTMLMQQGQFIKQNATLMKTWVIDTIDWAETLCIQHVCSANSWKSIEEPGYGKGYVYVAEEFGRFLNLLSDVIEAGVNVVLLAHSEIKKFEQPDEMGAYDRYQLKLLKQTAPLVKEWSDMLLFMNYKTYSVQADKSGNKYKGTGGQRTMYANHRPAWDAKNRHGLPDEFPMDFNQIAHIFYSAQPVQPQAPVQPVQPEITQAAPTQPLVEPVVEPTPQPAQPVTLEPVAPDPFPVKPVDAMEVSPNVPKPLQDLMIQNYVTESEIQIVVSRKGYYPADTPIENYDPGFISGVLVGAWEQVYPLIEALREEIPFN